MNKFGSVKDHMIRLRVFCSWNLQLRRNLNDLEVEDMGRLFEILDDYSIGDRNLKDEHVWTLDKAGGFSVKSLCAAMDQDTAHHFPVRFVWKTLSPSKSSFFMWLLWWDQAPTVDNLIRRGFITPNWCCLC